MSQRAILKVNGMSCGGCENAIKRALAQVVGVGEVTASHTDGRVEVTYDADKTNPAAFKQKIEGIGYHVVDASQ